MIHQTRTKSIIWIFALSFFFVLGSIFRVWAEDEADGTAGVSISPPIMELDMDPGTSVTKQIKLTNPLDHLVRLYPLAYDFLAQGEEGQQTFLPPSAESRNFSLASWIATNRSTISLAQNQEDLFSFQINVPENAEPGGHYGVMFFSTAPADLAAKPGQISVSGMVGSLILVRVSGDIREKARIEEFSAPVFSMKGPIEFVTRIENLGNVHFKPRGSINIIDWQGKNIESLDLNSKMGNVLPESIRRFENSWKEQGRWGRFTAKLSLSYGETKQTLDGKLVFWIIPLYVIIIAALILVLLIIGIVWLVRRAKSKRRFVSKIEPPRPKRIIQ